jgi:hypothetical protein
MLRATVNSRCLIVFLPCSPIDEFPFFESANAPHLRRQTAYATLTAMDVAAKMPLAQSASQRARGSERGKRCGSYATLGCDRPQRVRRQNAYATLCANFH